MEEVWKDIPRYEGLYQVSNLGNVFSKIKNKTRTLRSDKDGYLCVILCINSNQKNIKVHRLVMLAFIGPNDLQVNHINGIKTDNRLENLEYCTGLCNTGEAIRLGLIDNRGEKSTSAKLTEQDVLNIRELLKIKTGREVAKMYKVSFQQISRIKLKKRWGHI